MKKYLLPISLGCFSITAQALLVRDFLHCVEENELTLGILYFFWFIWIIPGSLVGKLSCKYSYLFPITSLLYIPSWLWGHFLVRNSRYISGIPTYELFNIHDLFLYSAIAPAGISFLTGFLFTHCVLWWEDNFSHETSNSRSSTVVRYVYAYEALGAVLGGVITSFSIYIGLSHWIPFCISVWFLITSSLLSLDYPFLEKVLPIALLPLLLLSTFLLESWENKSLWNHITKNENFKGKIITQKGEYLYGYDNSQFILLRNLKPVLSFPNQEYGLHLLSTFLAQKNDAKNILLIGEPFLYTLPYLININSIEKILWIPFDFELSTKIIPLLSENSLFNNKKLVFPQAEPHSFLKNTDDRFDIILVYTSDPQTISSNQYLTDSFFTLLKTHLADKGIAGTRISGGENFLGGEIATLGASIYFTFQQVFKVNALKPGNETWLFGSLTHPISEHIPTLEQRLSVISQQISEIKPNIVRDLYPADRIIFQKNRYEEVKKFIHEDYLIATENKYLGFLYSNLLYLWKQGYSGLLDKIITIKQITLFLIISSPLCFILARGIYKRKSIQKGKEKYLSTTLETYFAIFVIGTIGMGITILLLIQFQYRYGTLSTYIGLLSSMFMLGLSISPIIFNFLYADKNNKRPFFVLLFLVSICICYTLVILFVLPPYFYTYLAIFFLWGLTLSFLLSLFLNNLDKEAETAQIAVNLEVWDHLGAGIGAFIFPIILLPILGLQYAIGYILFSLLLILLCIPLLQKIPSSQSPSWGRIYGYTLFPILVLCFISTEIYYRSTVPLPEDTFTKIAQELSDGGKLQPETTTLPDNREIRYYSVIKKDENQNENISYIFSTASLFKVIGYGGEMDIAVKVSRDGNIENIKVIQSNETPDYLSLVENYFFLYKGKNIFQPETISGIDTVSGATTTADAVKRAVQFAGKEFTQIIQKNNTSRMETLFTHEPSAQTTYSIYIFLLFILLAIIFRFFYNDLLRTSWLISVALVLGFWLNIQYGLYSIVQLLSVDRLQFHFTISTLLTIGIPVLILINGNIYCGYLCPFGALSELISKLNGINKRVTPTKQTWYTTRQIKYILAFLFFLIYFFIRKNRLISIDPLLFFFTLDMSNYITIFGFCVLLTSLFYNRFWCRVLCPTGAFLSLIQSLRIFSFFWQRTFPAHCDLGISRTEEIDCIQCNRCYKHEKK